LFDIDKELQAMRAERYIPDEELRQKTRRLTSRAAREINGRKPRARKKSLLYYPATAVVLAVILALSVFSAAPAQAAGYYTIDINPSISVAVDNDENVLFVTAKNKEAKELLAGAGLAGMRFEDALKVVINSASQKGYLRDGGHLLVAHFGDSEGMSQQTLEQIVIEQLPERGVIALALNGGKDEFEKAQKAGQKPGIELLMGGAREVGIKEKDIDVVIDKMSEKPGKAAGGQSNDEKVNTGNNGNSGNANGNDGNNANDNDGNNGSGNNSGKGGSGNSGKGSGGNNEKQPNAGDSKGKDEKDNGKNKN
jgi:hypothetical protein